MLACAPAGIAQLSGISGPPRSSEWVVSPEPSVAGEPDLAGGPDLVAGVALPMPLPGAAEALPDAPVPAADAPEPASSSSSQQTSDPAAVDPKTGQPAGPQNGPEVGTKPTNPDAEVNPNEPHQTKRILGIMPNFRSVSADEHLPPQTAKDKLVAAAHDSFDYSSFIIAAIQSGISFAGDSYPEFGEGAGGYGQYLWHTLVDTADENFMVGGLFPIAFHQDSRFYTLGHGSFGHRAFYAFTRTLVSRSDSGNAMPNFSEVIGAGAAAGISSTYYPAAYRTWTKVGQKWLTSCIIDGANFTFKEFWPDINKHSFHQKQ